METQEKKLTARELANFTGTEQYYKHLFGGQYTDGVHYVAEKGGAYWLIDAIFSAQAKMKKYGFQVWKLKRTGITEPKKGEYMAILTMKEDTNKPTLVEQKFEYTDFPLDEIEMWLIDGVLTLTSEY